MIQRGPINVDLFAGGGGASEGMRRAGLKVDLAINHDREALAMHMVNHPETHHLPCDVREADPVEVCEGRDVRCLWASPDCTHFSKAKGGKPIRDAGKKSRSLAWVVTDWAEAVRPSVIMLENVEEFRGWGPVLRNGKPCKRRKGQTFKLWVARLEQLGYVVEWRELRACNYGAPTIRKRLFVIARCDGLPIVWPDETHAKDGDGGLKPWRTAAECIDWSIPCPSIFTRKRPLAENTMKRIAAGLMRYVIKAKEPFIVQLNHVGGDRVHSTLDPLNTVQASSREGKAVVVPYTVPRYGEAPGQEPRSRSIDQPATTVTPTSTGDQLVAAMLSKYHSSKAGESRCVHPDKPINTLDTQNRFALVSAFLAKHFGGMVGVEIETPFPTITLRGTQNQIVTSHLAKLRGTCKDGQPVTEPAPTLTAGGNHIAEVRAFLIQYYSSGSGKVGRCLKKPTPTLTTNDRLGLVTVAGVEYQIIDIGMRMLSPRELFRCQGFSNEYIIDLTNPATGRPLTKTAQVRMVGNSVPPQFAEALVRANVVEMYAEAVA